MQQAPNVLFILIDDMGWRDLSCFGSSFYETPHIDRLARQGVCFTNAYATCPVCSPSRASILTGKYPARLGLTDWINWGKSIHPAKGRLIDAPYIDHIPEDEYTLAHAFADVGHYTWHVGKWHLGAEGRYPEDRGFQVNVGGCHNGSPHPGGFFSPWGIPVLADAPVPEGTYLTDYLTDQAMGLIEGAQGRPFFLNMWYYSVHTPIQAKEETIAKYREKARRLKLDQIDPMVEGEIFPCAHRRPNHVKRRIIQSDPVYAAMIEHLDWNIGRLLDCLERTGQRENTIIVFTSDNGGLNSSEGSPTCNTPLAEGKGWMYEGGTRVPLIVQGPGVGRRPGLSAACVTGTDYYPTLLELCGLDARPGQHRDGVSFARALQSEGDYERPPMFWHYPHYGNQGGTPGSSIRLGDHKLIEFFEDGRLELYDLAKDPSEVRNLAEEQPAAVRDLHARLVAWREETNSLLPGVNPDWVD